MPANLIPGKPAAGGDEAAFGLDVLDRLIRILRLVAQAQRPERACGRGVVSCSMRMDDPIRSRCLDAQPQG